MGLSQLFKANNDSPLWHWKLFYRILPYVDRAKGLNLTALAQGTPEETPSTDASHPAPSQSTRNSTECGVVGIGVRPWTQIFLTLRLPLFPLLSNMYTGCTGVHFKAQRPLSAHVDTSKFLLLSIHAIGQALSGAKRPNKGPCEVMKIITEVKWNGAERLSLCLRHPLFQQIFHNKD